MEETLRANLSALMAEASGTRLKWSFSAYESYKARIKALDLDPQDYEKAIKSLARAMRV